MRNLLCSALVAACLSANWLVASDIFREPGAAYLEDITDERHYVFIRQPAPIFFELNFQRSLGTLRPGQRLELQAVAENAVRVKGRAQQGNVSGWVAREQIENLGDDFVEKVRTAYERFQAVRELIANKQVALGMTAEEVGASLGRPTNTRARVDGDGRKDVWEFITYERQARATGAYDKFGKPIYVYELIAVATISVTFADGAVVTVEETRDNVTRPRSVNVVSAPVVF